MAIERMDGWAGIIVAILPDLCPCGLVVTIIWVIETPLHELRKRDRASLFDL
jgi:hypothetical protein